ncbi:MAG: YeeE/YedE family protein [Polyangiaceae bacterium]|nr:YeeE/YedE family protein [Polyangiaceae bacterium]
MMFHTTNAVLGLAGGALIGVAAALYLATHGRIAGISGIVSGVLERAADWRPRLAFIVGLAATGALLALAAPTLFERPTSSLPIVAGAGLLVGFGTRLSNGCTSGHGVCGTSRLSLRSIAATLTFIATGAITVAVTHRVGGAQ